MPNTGNSFLCTNKDYGDFVLELEFKVDPEAELRRANSQPLLRRAEGTSSRPARRSRSPPAACTATRSRSTRRKRAWTGGIYDEGRRGWLNDLKNNEPARKAFKQGEWNKLRIECQGDSIKTWLNGVPAADLKDAMTPRGFIALQVHGVGEKTEPLEVRWRNIRISEAAP